MITLSPKTLIAIAFWIAPCLRAQLPEAPLPSPQAKDSAFYTRPFGINAIIGERYQTRQGKSAYTEPVIGAGISYRFLEYRASININYGYSLERHNQGVTAALGYRFLQFGPKRKATK